MMSRIRIAFFAVLGVLLTASSALAQATAAVAADNENTVTKYQFIAAAFGFAIAAAAGAIGQSRIAASAVEGAARNPGAAGRIQIMMILGLEIGRAHV